MILHSNSIFKHSSKLVWLTTAVMKHYEKSNWGRKEFFFFLAYTFPSIPCSLPLKEVRIGTQAGQKPGGWFRGHGRVLIADLFILLSYETQDRQPRVSPTQNKLWCKFRQFIKSLHIIMPNKWKMHSFHYFLLMQENVKLCNIIIFSKQFDMLIQCHWAIISLYYLCVCWFSNKYISLASIFSQSKVCPTELHKGL